MNRRQREALGRASASVGAVLKTLTPYNGETRNLDEGRTVQVMTALGVAPALRVDGKPALAWMAVVQIWRIGTGPVPPSGWNEKESALAMVEAEAALQGVGTWPDPEFTSKGDRGLIGCKPLAGHELAKVSRTLRAEVEAQAAIGQEEAAAP